MKKKLLNYLILLACLATVSVSCSGSAQAAVLGDDYPFSWKYGGFGVDPWTMYWRRVLPLRPTALATPMDSPYL